MPETQSETNIALPAMRVSYEQGSLSQSDLAGTWHEQLGLWLDEATRAGLAEPNAMVLATADPEGRPSSRTVLAKGLDARGLVFYTNYTSNKSHDLRATRYASATFPWLAMQRQATVRGTVWLTEDKCTGTVTKNESPNTTSKIETEGEQGVHEAQDDAVQQDLREDADQELKVHRQLAGKRGRAGGARDRRPSRE